LATVEGNSSGRRQTISAIYPTLGPMT